MIRNIPPITKNLLVINLLAFMSMLALKSVAGVDLNDWLGLHFFMASDFHVYQLVTYMFMHANFEHILFNMFSLWMFGCVVERAWGPRRFVVYYLVCGIGAGFLQELAQFGSFYLLASEQIPGFSITDAALVAANSDAILNLWTTVGASGAIYAILLAFGMTFPEDRLFIFPIPFPIKGKWFVVFCAAIELLAALSTSGDNVAHLAHVGGMLFGYILIRYWRKHPNDFYDYNYGNGGSVFDSLRRQWEQKKGKWAENKSAKRETDWDYNARKQREQQEIDAILDKIRRSGYDSLTREEKQRLFDQGNK